VNQVVAWNVAYYRRAAGLTQADLGERLGISAPNLSAAERSVDGKRPRNFDAGELLALALALGVPISALLMPPPEATTVAVPGGPDVTAGDLFRAALSVPADEGTAARLAYIDRYVDLEAEHASPDTSGDAATLLDDAATRKRLTARLDRIRGQREALREVLDDLTQAEETVAGNLDELGGDPR
jgi:transcriptional regulator with XRE-family HTH domain